MEQHNQGPRPALRTPGFYSQGCRLSPLPRLALSPILSTSRFRLSSMGLDLAVQHLGALLQQ